MVVMARSSIVVMLDGWIVRTEPPWTVYRPVQIWTIGLYIVGALAAGARAQHIVACLVLTTYVVAGFFIRFMPAPSARRTPPSR